MKTKTSVSNQTKPETHLPIKFGLSDQLGMLLMDAIVASGVKMCELEGILAQPVPRERLVLSMADAIKQRAEGARRIEVLIRMPQGVNIPLLAVQARG